MSAEAEAKTPVNLEIASWWEISQLSMEDLAAAFRALEGRRLAARLAGNHAEADRLQGYVFPAALYLSEAFCHAVEKGKLK